MSADDQTLSLSYSHQQVALAIIGAGITNAVTVTQYQDPFNLWFTMVGIIVLCILYAYKPLPSSPRVLNVAFSATWSFTLLTASGVLFNILYRLLGGSFFEMKPDTPWSPFPIYDGRTWSPFTQYDLTFFLLWVILFGVCLYTFQSKPKDKKQGTPLENQPSTEQTSQMNGTTTSVQAAISGPPSEQNA